MFADPQSITIGASPFSLNKINQDGYSSEYLYKTSTWEVRLNIRNTSYIDKKRGVRIERHNFEVVQTIYPVAPATLSSVRKAYFVVEAQQGDSQTDIKDVAVGLCSLLTATSAAAITKALNFES